MAKKSRTQQSLLKEAKKLFRTTVRYRDTNVDGWGRCISCNKKQHIDATNAGHFDHNHNSTYFLEDNCHVQCIHCNNWLHGNLYPYGRKLDEMYGEGTADRILAEGKKEKRRGKKELQQMIDEYKETLKDYETNS